VFNTEIKKGIALARSLTASAFANSASFVASFCFRSAKPSARNADGNLPKRASEELTPDSLLACGGAGRFCPRAMNGGERA
jgi:hypothetical protein